MYLINMLKYNLLKEPVFMLSFFFMTNSLLAGETDSLFMSDKVIKMELRSDFSAILTSRTGKPEFTEGELIYYTPGDEPTKISVKVMARGNFRLNPENCSFPPLLVDFRKNDLKNTIFDNQDRLKLVTPCQSEEDLIEEYTVYKMYNQVTDLSLKVRLVRILYFDTGIGKKVFKKYSFFIEEKEHVAKRNNASETVKFLTPFDLDIGNFKKMSVFQYIIGNNDWFITLRKNVILMQPEDTMMAPYAIPYDFDFSRFVSAKYAEPKKIPGNFISDRSVYKGLCYTDDEFSEIFEFYRKIRPVFESTVKRQKLISQESKNQIIKYINRFYTVIENRELIKKEFLDVCETRKDYNIFDSKKSRPDISGK
jgi:hypothetical protein